MTNFLIDNIFI